MRHPLLVQYKPTLLWKSFVQGYLTKGRKLCPVRFLRGRDIQDSNIITFYAITNRLGWKWLKMTYWNFLHSKHCMYKPSIRPSFPHPTYNIMWIFIVLEEPDAIKVILINPLPSLCSTLPPSWIVIRNLCNFDKLVHSKYIQILTAAFIYRCTKKSVGFFLLRLHVAAICDRGS